MLIVVVFKAPSWGFGATSRCGPQTLPQVREWIRKPRVRALGGPRLQVCSSALPVMLSEDKARFSGSSGPVTAVPQRVFAPGKGGDSLGITGLPAIHPLAGHRLRSLSRARSSSGRPPWRSVRRGPWCTRCACVCASGVCTRVGAPGFAELRSLSNQRPGGAGLPAPVAVSYLRRNYPWCVRFICDESYKDNFFLSIKSCLGGRPGPHDQFWKETHVATPPRVPAWLGARRACSDFC